MNAGCVHLRYRHMGAHLVIFCENIFSRPNNEKIKGAELLPSLVDVAQRTWSSATKSGGTRQLDLRRLWIVVETSGTASWPVRGRFVG
jgi:hypothetical protein